jgi:hypothetical protein
VTNYTPVASHFKRMFNAGVSNLFRAQVAIEFLIILTQHYKGMVDFCGIK